MPGEKQRAEDERPSTAPHPGDEPTTRRPPHEPPEGIAELDIHTGETTREEHVPPPPDVNPPRP